jgi:hypothetical protein
LKQIDNGYLYMMSIFGENGESAGKAKEGEKIFRGEGAAASFGRAAESGYARELGEQQKMEQETSLRADIRKLDESIRTITASIESLVGKMQEGRKIAEEEGNEKLLALNIRLEEETQKEKMRLLGEKEALEMEKQALETKLGNLSL